MEEQNKKQIVIIVVIIIILILSLLGLLVFAVITNDGNNIDISNTTTTMSTTIPIESTTISTENTTSSVVDNNDNIVSELNMVMNNYLSEIKTDGKIGEFKVVEISVIDLNDETQKCPDMVYDENKIYANVIIQYDVLDDTFALTDNESITDGKAISSATFIFALDGDTYKVENLFIGC